MCFFFEGYGDHRDLPSFPTRRSSDLASSAREVPVSGSSSARVETLRPTPTTTAPLPTSARMPASFAPPAASRSLGHFSERSEEHTSELQSRQYLVCRLLLEKKKPARP